VVLVLASIAMVLLVLGGKDGNVGDDTGNLDVINQVSSEDHDPIVVLTSTPATPRTVTERTSTSEDVDPNAVPASMPFSPRTAIERTMMQGSAKSGSTQAQTTTEVVLPDTARTKRATAMPL